MLQQHSSRFINIMETIEETAETFCQVSADCKVTSDRGQEPGQPTNQNYFRMFFLLLLLFPNHFYSPIDFLTLPSCWTF